MAHVHGAAAKVAAEASNHAAQAAHHTAHAAHAATEHGAHLAQAAKHAADAAAGKSKLVPVATSFHNLAKGAAATGAAVTAGNQASRSFISKVFRHPLVVFGLGVAVGYTIHKYRKEIIASANRAAETSKDFVLQQRENLEDLVAGSQETENS